MYFTDAICRDCGEVFEIIKNTIEEDFVVTSCPKCKSDNVFRRYELAAFSVAEGILGNSKNGYSKGFVYNPSSLTGKLKGRKI